MHPVVIYRSKTGFSKIYAQWIADELQADLFDARGFAAADFDRYDTVVFGGGCHAGGINGSKLIKRSGKLLAGKKLAVFACGASPVLEATVQELKTKNFSAAEQKTMGFFYLRGGFNFSKLPPFDKFLMSLMKNMLKRKKSPTPDEAGMLASYDNPQDFSNRESIGPLLAYVRS